MTLNELIEQLKSLQYLGDIPVQFPNMEFDAEVTIHDVHYWPEANKIVFNKEE